MAVIDKRFVQNWIDEACALSAAARPLCRRGMHDVAQLLLNGGIWPRVAVAAVLAAVITLPSYLAQSAVRLPVPAQATSPAVAPPPSPVLTTAKVDRLDAYARETQSEEATAATVNGSAAGEGGAFDWTSASRRISTHTTTGANGERTYAIRVTVPEGTPVRAAAAGVVEFSGDATDGQGNKVVLRHGAVTTIYAHASELLVKVGERVRKGQLIAKSGQSGFATTPRLYLAIVSGDPTIDPISFFAGSMKGSTEAERCADAICDDRKPARNGAPASKRPVHASDGTRAARQHADASGGLARLLLPLFRP